MSHSRRFEKRLRHPGGDHMFNRCECNDCRKRRKHPKQSRVHILPLWLRMERARAREADGPV